MKRVYLNRNIRARDQLDIFLVSAISSLLGVRFYLELTGYPQISTGSLHIAHILWGGLFMVSSIVILLSFLGLRAQQVSSILGGIGFGIFIDELGKFITRDNNYFFQPTVGIIYAIFVMLYLLFNFLTKDQSLTSREYQLNAIAQIEEAISYDLDAGEKRRALELLAKADPKNELTIALKKLVNESKISADEKPGWLYKIFERVDKAYSVFWNRKGASSAVRLFFIIQALALFFSILFTTYSSINDIGLFFDLEVSYGEELIVGQFLSATAAGAFVLYGLVKLTESRLHAFEQFRRSVLINIYLTEFFVFSRIQFDALPGLAINIGLLAVIGFVLREERRLQS